MGNFPSVAGPAPSRVLGDLSRSNLTAFLGDSITIGNGAANIFGGAAYPTIVSENSGGIIRLYINAGVSGNTTAQVLARVNSDVINSFPRPGKCVVLMGTNDMASVSTAVSLANVAATYDQLRAAGIESIGCTIPPLATNQSKVAAFNVGIKALCMARGMICIDIHSVLVDPATGQYLAGYSGDGIHPNSVGRRAISTLFQAKLTPFYRPIPPNLCQDNIEATNLIADGMFLGTPTGGVAASWTGNALSGTITPTIQTGDTNILGNWQVLTTTVTGQYYLSQAIAAGTASPAGWAAGDVLEFSGLIDVVAEAGGAAPTARVQMTGGPAGVYSATQNQSDDVTRGVFFVRFSVLTGHTGMNIQLFNSGSVSGTGTVKFAQPSLYNLTRLGVA